MAVGTSASAHARGIAFAAVLAVLATGVVGVADRLTTSPADTPHGVQASDRSPTASADADLRSLPTAAQGVVSEALGRHDEDFAAAPGPEGIAFTNPVHGLAATVNEDGITVDAAGSGVGLTLASYGRVGTVGRVAAATPVVNANRIERDRGGLREWFVNGPAGVQQGFTLVSPPAADRGQLELRMMTPRGMRPRITPGGRSVAFAGTGLRYGGLFVADATGRELSARFVATHAGLAIRIDDRRAVWPITVDPTFTQQAFVKASNTGGGDRLGISVAISADTMVVGADSEDSCATGVGGDQTSDACSDAGVAYVFVRSGSTWSQQAYLKASNTGAGDMFGASVAISGDTVAVGAFQEDSCATGVGGDQTSNACGNAGAVYVFVRSGTVWSQQAYVKASNTAAVDSFGAVAISADTMVVGAYAEDSCATGIGGDQTNNACADAGAAYVFVRSGSTWSQQAYLKESNTGAGDGFGLGVSVATDTVVIGAPNEDSCATGIGGDQTNNACTDAGAVYVFARSGSTWSQQGYVKASNTGASDSFGRVVTTSGDTVAVGAWKEASCATGVGGDETSNACGFAGAVYVFVRSGSTWSQQAYVKASNAASNDGFGYTVAISGDLLVVGAWGEDSCASGVGGDQTSNDCEAAGAVYLFARSGSTWSQQAYVKASNTNAADYFSYSVAISGGTVAVGAFLEDSCGTGIGGDQTSNACLGTGAAYVFVASPPATPTGVTSTPAGITASIGFVPGDAGVSPPSYTASCASSNGGATQAATGTGSPITVGNLTGGAAYTCRVKAANAAGSSDWSSPSSSFIVPQSGATGTVVAYTGATKAATGTAFTVSARLTTASNTAIKGKVLYYRFGDEVATALPATDRNGSASVTVTRNSACSCTLWVWFPGDATYKFGGITNGSAVEIKVTQSTSVSLFSPSSPVTASRNTTVSVTALLAANPGSVAVSGEVVSFQVRSGTKALSTATATTGADGKATATVTVPKTAGNYVLRLSHAATVWFGASTSTDYTLTAT